MTNPAEILLKVYGAASVARIAGNESDPEGAYASLEAKFSDKAGRQALVLSMPAPSIEFLAFMDRIDRRLRGERLKKRWFLHGYEDFEMRILPLIQSGIVVVGNVQSREPISLETALDQGLLQQWIQVTPGFESLAGEPPVPREVVQQVSDATRTVLERRLLVVEFNVLNCARYVESESIRLNRDGSPHRSDLKGLAPMVIDVAETTARGDAAPDPLTVQGWDIITFLLSVAEALGLIQRTDDTLTATTRRPEYFVRPLNERLQILTRALEHQRAWSELDAARWFALGEPPVTGEGDGGFVDEGGHGASLAGPRSSVFAAIRRLNPHDWFDVDETARTITSLEHQYLRSALPIPTGDETGPFVFVKSVITRTLPHVGAIDLGRGTSNELRARLTDVGKAMLGMAESPVEPDGKGAILVEPNFEVTAFLDLMNLRLLHDLSRFSELTRTSERVARYRLHGESAQWGYARGYTADGVLKLLHEFSAQPIPPSVSFALHDWERLHRRVTVFLNGDLVAATGKSDPEVMQSGVQFAIHDPSQVERIDALHTFVAVGHGDALERALDAAKPRIIDYNGPIEPSLEWIDETRVRAPTGATDLRTLAALSRVAEQESDEVFRISPDVVKSTHPNELDGFQSLLTILGAGLIGGLSAEREIVLKGMLGHPADGRIESLQVLLVGQADDGERIDRIESVAPFIEMRLGPRAFLVKEGKADELAARLRALGIAIELR